MHNDPANLRDLWGLAAWQKFKTIQEARDDFGKNYNDDSMEDGIEYGTTIYKDTQTGEYYYSTPNQGKSSSVWMLTNPAEQTDAIVELTHTHGNVSGNPEKLSEGFKGSDKDTADTYNVPVSAFAPSGTCYIYDPTSGDDSYNNSAIPHVEYNENGKPIYPKKHKDPSTERGKAPNNETISATAMAQITAGTAPQSTTIASTINTCPKNNP